MTAKQKATVDSLKAMNFVVSTKNKDVVRMARGADLRIVFADGSQKRSNHTHYQEMKGV